jgi:hypothetical protein
MPFERLRKRTKPEPTDKIFGPTMANGSEGMPEKRAYQWFFLFICVARPA